jgi:endonuclease YncB( thermonuclease family)
VQCEILGRDDFGRTLGVCSAADTELNATMVRHGWAFAFVKYSQRYVAEMWPSWPKSGYGPDHS